MTRKERIDEYQMEYEYICDLLSHDSDNDDLIDAMYNIMDLFKENGGNVNGLVCKR